MSDSGVVPKPRDPSTVDPWKEEDLKTLKFMPVPPELYAETVDCINEAFLVDAFFKYPEYVLRTSIDEMKHVMENAEQNHSIYLVGVFNDTLRGTNVPRVAAAIQIDWALKKVEGKDELDTFSNKLWGTFGSVSVYPWFEKRGIGQQVVEAAEQFLRDRASTLTIQSSVASEENSKSNTCVDIPVVMDILVLNVRPELKGWYNKQGYVIYDEDAPFTYNHIVLPGYTVRGVMMKKDLGTVSVLLSTHSTASVEEDLGSKLTD